MGIPTCCFRSTIVALLTVASAWTAAIYRADLPNFYQHQKAFQGQYPDQNADGTWTVPEANPLPNPPDPLQAAPDYNSPKNWWERGGGWCCTTAVSDMLYALQKDYFPQDPNLYWGPGETGARSWFEYQNYGIEKFYFDFFKTANTFEDILVNRGFGPDRIIYQEYFVDGAGKVELSDSPTRFCGVCAPGSGTVAFANMHDLYDSVPTTGSYIALNVVSSSLSDEEQDRRGIWWNYHVIVGAGIDLANDFIYIADPNRNNTGSNRGVGPNAGIGWGHPYASTDAFPGTAADYQVYRISGNKLVAVDPNNTAYDGLTIQSAMVLTATPEPATLACVGMVVTVLFLVKWRRVIGGGQCT